MKSSRNMFGRPAANRRGIERASDEWVLAQREASTTRFVVSMHEQYLVERGPALRRFGVDELPGDWRQWPSIYLGEIDAHALFALDAPGRSREFFEATGEFAELRAITTALPESEAALLAHTRAVLHWHRRNRFCGACGTAMQVAAAGHARLCTNNACEIQEIFPRIDPAVIVLVMHEDKCLLGRQQSWPPGRYSCIAGFGEAGETLEETVRREVYEEAGVNVVDISYESSQPWPFPQSLMVGFRARALSPVIQLHDDELEDARWFSREDILAGVRAGNFMPSSRLSIAWWLLHDWYSEGADAIELERELDLK